MRKKNKIHSCIMGALLMAMTLTFSLAEKSAETATKK